MAQVGTVYRRTEKHAQQKCSLVKCVLYVTQPQPGVFPFVPCCEMHPALSLWLHQIFRTCSVKVMRISQLFLDGDSIFICPHLVPET